MAFDRKTKNVELYRENSRQEEWVAPQSSYDLVVAKGSRKIRGYAAGAKRWVFPDNGGKASLFRSGTTFS